MKTKTIKALAGASALVIASATSAHAAGTLAGTSVENTFTLDYEVNNVPQDQIINNGQNGNDAPTAFTVDRLIDVTVASNGDVTGAPGEQDVTQTFSVTNTGNDTQSYVLTAIQEANGFANNGNTDDFDTQAPTITVYRDTDGSGTLTAADAVITVGANGEYGDIAPDETIFVTIESDIPANQADGSQATVSLLAETAEPSTGANPGQLVAEDNDGNTLEGAAENVFADADGTTGADAAEDGKHSDSSTVTVAAADVTAVKSVAVLDQGPATAATCSSASSITTTALYHVPGACVEYRITVENDGSAPAEAVDVRDFLPEGVTFVSATTSGFTGGAFNPALPAQGADCDGDLNASFQPTGTTCEVRYQGATVPVGATGTSAAVLFIRALIQ